jgi:serine/threonine protein kinase/formylglycine-generating enzyme required for sulfatase activity
MANSSELDKVRAALAALETGATDLRDLETLIGKGLSAGSFTRTEANTVLRDAIQTGALSSDAILQLLGPDEVFDDATRLRRRVGSPGSVGNRNNPDSSRSDTQSALSLPTGTTADGQLLSDRYLLERKLGQGGMGVVYFARDLQVGGETFAIKLLNSEIRQLPEALEMVREEVRKTRSLAHPNIVGVYSVNVDRDDVFILMEYLEGKALNTVLDDDFGRGMPFNRAWPWIQDICTGLAYAHDHSVIHSDLKPSNIFVTTSGKAKLLDFGIARAARGGTGRFDPATLAALTPAYASCEMLEGDKPDQRDDVYALGCVIYEMLSGKHPFDGASALDARRDGLKPPPLASLTKRQNAALAQALAFDRAKRTDTVEALLTGLGPTGSSSRFSVGRPRPLVWIGGVGLVLLLLIGFIWFLNGTKDKNSQLLSGGANSSQPSNDALLNRVQALVAKADALELDPADLKLQQGKQQLNEARERSAAGENAEGQRLLGEAENNLGSAIRSAKRLVHIGSDSAEIAVAMRLCQQIGSRCTAADFADETPRTVALAPFELDNTETTNRQFGEFVAANKYMTAAEHAQPPGLYASQGSKALFQTGQSWKTLRDSMGAGVDASVYPVRGIDFNTANDYCSWRGARLPTEDEWEYVARGVDRRIFAWGNEPRLGEPETRRGLHQVNEQPMTGRFGARGLGDGTLEWVNGVVTPGRVLRGASWLDKDPLNQRLASRRVFDDSRIYALIDTGLRCAKSVESWPDQAVQGSKY